MTGLTQQYGHTLDVVISRADLPKPIIKVRSSGEFCDHSLINLVSKIAPAATIGVREYKHTSVENF